MVNILGFDSSVGPVSVAVWKNGHIAAYLEDMAKTMQSARLLPMIEQALKKSGIGYHDLSAVACTVGPGSFTGIRVSLATARGIALAAGIKGLGFTTLEVLAFAAQKISPLPVLALLNAGKGEYYYQPFALSPSWEPRGDAALGIPKTTNIVHTAGNVLFPGYDALPITFPRADALVGLAAMRAETAQPLEPLYIRPPDAKPMADVG